MKNNNIAIFKKNELLVDRIRKIHSQLKKENIAASIINEKSNTPGSSSTEILDVQHHKFHCKCCNSTISSNNTHSSNASNSSNLECDTIVLNNVLNAALNKKHCEKTISDSEFNEKHCESCGTTISDSEQNKKRCEECDTTISGSEHNKTHCEECDTTISDSESNQPIVNRVCVRFAKNFNG